MNKVYGIITERLVKAVESGATLPWRKAWTPATAPRSLVSGKAYRGINAFILAMAPYGDPRWLTFKQAKAKGAKVRKGEKATPIIFWKVDVDRVEDEETGESKVRRSFILRYYNVFNVEQVDGLDLPALPAARVNDPVAEAEALVEAFVANGGPALEWGAAVEGPHYAPASDVVRLPSRERFESSEDVYDALFHEFGHSTGHASRLNREGIVEHDGFGSERYGKEELVAEFTAAFILGSLGLDRTEVVENEAAYLASWLKSIKGDPTLLVSAAGKAQKAADLILGSLEADEEPDEEAVLVAA